MSRESNSKHTYQSNITFLFCSLCLAALLAATQASADGATSRELATDIVPSTVALVDNVSPWSVEPELPRDPWANPIVSCSFVVPREFGYDQKEIYRLPQQPRPEWKGAANGMRDPWQID